MCEERPKSKAQTCGDSYYHRLRKEVLCPRHCSTTKGIYTNMSARPALWTTIYQAAVRSNHPDPEKMADTAMSAREKSLALIASRPKILMTKAPPKATETCVAAKPAKNGRVVPSAAFRCNAQTLEGRQCGFKATCGNFCSKHAPV